MENLIERFLQKDRIALSKLITLAEDDSPRLLDIMKAVYPLTGKAYVIGVTGPPGAGKSTLVDKLIRSYRSNGYTVGVICVDPSSIFSGGAFLGDRVRMEWAYRDDGVYLRSLATRGALGGLAPRINEIIKLLDAFGQDVIIIETVGVGQMEADIIRYADTKVVVSVPGLGDQMQALKAGIMEIADVLVVNKADLPGAQDVVNDLQMMLRLRKNSDWIPEIILTEALNNRGVSELYEAAKKHRMYLIQSGVKEQQAVQQRGQLCQNAVQEQMKVYLQKCFAEIKDVKAILKVVQEGSLNPYQGADEIRKLLLK
ncbi:methylmalonyl Co-A mutase-associated GTPase MeaB [Sporomusa sphaeroides DSM 2875]|uniref:methylmalonyl Co-A mutase-associated GTPase MeaB n=1 Tax=Sporomusa sphaeroides TaxID=47679 RepID=UPI00203097EC|nr:methylmalonyl Co-A mutase-associated GTPase MeaB [Sporomusa sphaeroides]MCM0759491.1 methylmalonyl Co-A mutase-associated GTPase MeaB [Sporomusa sphaeroides DSM 2875]